MRDCIQRLGHDRRGNFAMMAALLAVPLVMSAGVLIDLSTIGRIKSELQNAIDSAALAVAREGKQISDEQARRIASNFLSNNLDPTHTKLQVMREETLVRVSAETRAKLSFGSLFGYDNLPILAAASADTAYVSYEVALVLDTTGAMAGGKLVAMKDAVLGLVDTMAGQVGDKNKLDFSLVPFSGFVNVGPEHGPSFDKNGIQIAGTGAKWLDLEGKSPIPQTEIDAGISRFQLYHNLGRQWTGCVETRMAGTRDYDVSAEPAETGRPESLFVPAFAIDEPDEPGYANSYIVSNVDPLDMSVAAKQKRWAKYGVATDNAGGPSINGILNGAVDLLSVGNRKIVPIDTGPSGFQGFNKGPEFGCSAQPLTPLTNDYKLLSQRVKALEARGTVNVMEGVAWGTRVLTPGEPFEQARPAAKGALEKIMIVLTGGSNEMGTNNTALRSTYSSFGFLIDGRLGLTAGGAAATGGLMNDKTLKACEHAKKDGIIIYTIRLEEPDAKTGTMLQQCATTPAHYFDVPSRSQLDEVFDMIRDRIVRVRIAS